jgi:8-amino-7-oxononanoate synthase
VTDPNGESLVSFCSNDYLGLAAHPAISLAAHRTAAASGFGAGASRLLGGDFSEHRSLEGALASLVRLPAALLFPTGYQANLGVITALAGPSDLIVADRAVHASIIDGCRLSKAKLAFYPHLDLEKADHFLATFGPKARRRLLITESLFSMDGDIAQLTDLSELAKVHDAVLYVDEAHALGLLGPGGAGLCAEARIRPDVLIGTLGKAIGAAGAFASGSALLCDYLINRARTFIFTTALPPPLAAAATESLRIITSSEGDSLRVALAANIAALRTRLRLPPQDSPSPILPLILGTDHAAVSASQRLRARGLFVQPIRPPTVPDGTCRLRLTVSAAHTERHLSLLADALTHLGDEPPPHQPDRHVTVTHPSSRPPSGSQAPSGLLVAGTDTGVGKTAVASAILALLAERGASPVPFKPVETGARPQPQDAIALLQAARRPDLPLRVVCPFSFPDPIAPAAAAAQQGVDLSLPTILSHFRSAAAYGSVILVEAAGGLLSPYAPALTAADLATAFGLPVLLVARNSLGTVNHTALAIAEIRRRRLPFAGLILVNVTAAQTPDQRSNARLIHDVAGVAPLGALPYVPDPNPTDLARQLEASVDLGPLWAALSTSPRPRSASGR